MTAADDLTRHIQALGASMTPVRDLTLSQAWSLVEGYALDGTIPGLTIPAVRDRKLAVAASSVAGVEFKFVLSFDGKTGLVKDSAARPIKADPALGLDVRMVVFLVRLARLLKADHGANVVYHLGFDGVAEDMHRDGRAMDFVGIAGKRGGADFEINVFSHWKLQPVQMPVAFGGIAKGAKLADWPNDFHATVFRLDAATNQHLEVKPWFTAGASAITAARDLFAAVYDFAATNGMDTSDGSGPTTIGAQSRNILHPDYFQTSVPPNKDGRNDHFQHMHMQIGSRASPLVRQERWLPV